MNQNLYTIRFSSKERKMKQKIWKVLCESFFQRFIDNRNVVLDLGCGSGEFINNIKCKKKFALDIEKENLKFVNKNVKIFCQSCTNLSKISDNFFNVVFVSNLFEHLISKKDVEKTLKEIFRVLKMNGKLLILQPNIKYAYKEYWDFFDHNLPFSHLSMCEIIQKVGFNIILVMPRFLPYTTKNIIPKNVFLIKLYLNLRLLQKIFGKQMFIVAEK